MKKLLMYGAVVAGMLAGPAGAAAQGMLGVEVRGGAAFPTGDLKDVMGAETGVSYGVTATLQAISMLGIYAGYERAEFGADDLLDDDASLTDEGFSVGGKLSIPAGMSGLGPWIRAGAVYNQLTGESSLITSEDERKLGFEVGAGLTLPLGMVVSVTPGIRYRSYGTDRVSGGEELNVSYVVADLGLAFRF